MAHVKLTTFVAVSQKSQPLLSSGWRMHGRINPPSIAPLSGFSFFLGGRNPGKVAKELHPNMGSMLKI
jgi:hypothetical protein